MHAMSLQFEQNDAEQNEMRQMQAYLSESVKQIQDLTAQVDEMKQVWKFFGEYSCDEHAYIWLFF